MTRTPESVSRITRLIRSIFFWSARNSGIAWYMTSPMSAIMSGMITSRTPDSGTSWRSAMITPPTTMIGAEIIMVSARSRTGWTCWTSLVLRVIRLAAPNVLTSTCENVSTLRKMPLRTSRPKAIADLALQ